MKYFKRFLLIMLCLPLITLAQDQSAIHWATGLTWQQVKEKAKKENKYIFVDCYATWCKPCKKMDKEVYTVDSVGDYLNAGFISVKLQMDATKNDNAEVRSWYKTAREIEKQYHIDAFPSFVFFSPGGEVISKEVGYKDPAGFIQAAREATDPSKQYFVLLKKYKQGKLDHAGTVLLINQAQRIGDTADYRQILNSYYAYLHKQKKGKLYTKENIEFAASTLTSSSQLLFDMFYPNAKEVNRVMQSDWYAKKLVDKIINVEKIQPFFKSAQGQAEPDWNVLQRSIAKDYRDDYVGRNVLQAKIEWYAQQNDALKFATYLNDKMEQYGSDTTNLTEDLNLNNAAYMIWLNVGKAPEMNKEIKTELSRACGWMEGVARRGKNLTEEYAATWDMYIDTYACLLQKIGKTDEAISWEEFARLKLKEIVKDKKALASGLEAYEYKLDKMKKGEPLWPIDAK